MTKTGIIILLIYLIFGAYFINLAFPFYETPEAISQFEEMINLVGGILIILGGINSMRLARKKNHSFYSGIS